MTYVSNKFVAPLKSDYSLNFYCVGIVTFDGQSFTELVEAESPDDAQEIAASWYAEVDYTMIHGIVNVF